MDKAYRIEPAKKNEEIFIRKFVKDIREVDAYELTTCSETPEEELRESLKRSAEAYKVSDIKGRPLVIYGVIDELEGGLIWCVGTNALRNYWIPFTRESKAIISRWKKEYGILFNAVTTNNLQAIHWLRSLEAVFGEPFEFNRREFRRFEIRNTEEE